MTAARHEDVFDMLTIPIGGVHQDNVLSVWDRVEPLLARVVKPDTGFRTDDVLTQLQIGNWQLWVIGDFQGVVVTYVEVRPLEKVFFVRYIAGNYMNEWLDDWVKVQESFAKANLCKAVVFFGRRGWDKWQRRYKDYKQITTEYRKQL